MMTGAQWYVSPTGSGSACTKARPCDINWARMDADRPGETIWLRGGTYNIVFDGKLNQNFYGSGTATEPLIIRSYPGELATIKVDGGQWWAGVQVAGSYQWFWGIEFVPVKNSDRISAQTGSSASDISHYGNGIRVRENLGPLPGIKVINCILHDNIQGITVQNGTAPDFEAYGNLIYYNGWQAPDRGHGHGIYVQTPRSGLTHRIRHNLIFHNASHGLQAFGSSTTYANNLDIDGNTIWGNSDIPPVMGGGREFVSAGTNVSLNGKLANNRFYSPDDGDRAHLGWSSWPENSMTGWVISGNYFAVDLRLQQIAIPAGVTVNANTFVGNVDRGSGYSTADFSSNEWFSPKQTYAGPAKAFVEPNDYEPGRGIVTIFNWPGAATVPVDLSAILPVGTAYIVQYAMDFFGPPVLSGTYEGGTVAFPMTGLSMAEPAGDFTKPQSYLPKFAAFVVLPVPGGGPSSPPVATRRAG